MLSTTTHMSFPVALTAVAMACISDIFSVGLVGLSIHTILVLFVIALTTCSGFDMSKKVNSSAEPGFAMRLNSL